MQPTRVLWSREPDMRREYTSMPATLEEVQAIIQQEFPGSDVRGLKEENHRVVGTIIWDGFKHKDSEERNRLVTERVRNKLGLRGINVGILFPLAPGEEL